MAALELFSTLHCLPARLLQQPFAKRNRGLLFGTAANRLSYTAHFGEEPALVGTNGAGNIFFGNCNLRCVYCQNYQISQTHKEQLKNEITHERLAEIMLELQAKGCHNINFVSPTHFAPQLARSVLLAAQAGLNVPVVYNTNAYDRGSVLLLEGIVASICPISICGRLRPATFIPSSVLQGTCARGHRRDVRRWA